jgi:hypothetical protein
VAVVGFVFDTLQYLCCGNRGFVKDIHIPLESLLVSIRNELQNAVEEEAHILLESLMISVEHSIQNALEEE